MNRRNAWTPVGIDVDGAKDSHEALRMAGLDWEVEKKPVFNQFGKEIKGWFANTRTDDGSVLGVVGNKYKIVQNKDAFDFTDALIGEGVQYEKAGDWKRGSAIWLEAKLPETRKILGDDVESHVVFINSHDGKGSVKVAMVPTRLFCSNQLNMALKEAQRTWSACHSSRLEVKMESAKSTLGMASRYMDELGKEAERLAMQKVSDTQFLEILNRIYPVNEDDTARKIASVNETRMGLLDALKADDMWDFKDTAYGKMMAVTDFFDHREPQRQTEGYWNNNWMAVANGHPMVDRFYSEIKALA